MEVTTILPLISSIFVFTLGFFVFLKNYKSRLNFTFFLHALAITVWLFGTFMMFLNKSDITEAIFWDRFVYVGVVFIPAFMYHFCLAVTDKKSNFFLYLAYILSLFFLVISRTDYFVKDVFVYQWGIHTRAQFFHHIFLIYFCSYALAWFVIVFRHYRKSKSASEKLQIRYYFTAFLLLFTIGPLAYLPAYGIAIYPFSYLSGLIFVIILAYAITRYNLMNVKVITTEVFSGLLIVTSLIPIFQFKTASELVIRIFTLAITVFFAILIIRSVHAEVNRREEVELLAKKLQKASKELKAANKELQRLDEAKSEFLSIASHQLRTPLTIIKGFISMMVEGSYGPISGKVKENLKKMYIASERLISLVETLLNISRIEAGRLEFNLKPADLGEVVKSLVEDFQQKAKEKKLKLGFYPEKDLPKVLMDGEKIKEVISNFLDNAVKYTEKGEITASLHQESQSVVFSCQDTGRGIEPDDLPRLFNKFVRGKGMMQIHTEGTGLGLYFGRMVIENMGGRIWGESPGKNQGSKFSFSLPLADKKEVRKINPA